MNFAKAFSAALNPADWWAMLLKIDVPGHEFEVLAGLGNLAGCVRWVYAKTSFLELYTGQKLHDEVVGFLATLGYEQVLEHNLVTDRDRKIRTDILFQKRAV